MFTCCEYSFGEFQEKDKFGKQYIDLINGSGAFIIIEAFYAAVPYNQIETSTFSYGGNLNNGKTLTTNLILKARNIRNDTPFHSNSNSDSDANLTELFRKFHCYGYRALATIITNTSSGKPEVYNLALFKEVDSKLIWRKLVNVQDENIYSNWSQDFDELPKLKEYILSIKDLEANDNEKALKRQYINTVSIFDRSLSQTLSKSDLSYSVVLSNREALEDQRNENKHQTTMRITLENTPINDHEIMSSLVAVINFMYTQKLLIFHDYEQQAKEKYGFVLSIAESLNSPTQHKNVKIFLAKLIENCRSIFANFAKILVGPILTLLTSKTLGEKLNFFITDLVTMLISWNHVPQDMQAKGEAGVLLNFLIKNAYNERNEIFNLNLALIKKFVESWSEVLDDKISFATLIEMLEHDDKIICGLQLNAIIIANEMTPWVNEEQRNRYVKAILRTFNNTSPKIYQPGAQLLGICLHLIIKEGNSQEVLSIVNDKLKRLEKDRSKSDLLLELLYGISKGYPMILDSFMSRISASICTAIRKSKCICLEMFLARLEIIQDNEIYRTLDGLKIRNLLKKIEYQKLALHIVNKSIDKLKSTEFMRFLEELIQLLSLSQPDAETRIIIYEIMINASEKYKNDFTERHRTMSVILKGFSDPEPMIQNRVLNFLTRDSGLSNSFSMRFQQTNRD